MERRKCTPEENECGTKILELLQTSNISSMGDIQNLFKETIAEFMENGLDLKALWPTWRQFVPPWMCRRLRMRWIFSPGAGTRNILKSISPGGGKIPPRCSPSAGYADGYWNNCPDWLGSEYTEVPLPRRWACRKSETGSGTGGLSPEWNIAVDQVCILQRQGAVAKRKIAAAPLLYFF